MSTPFLGFDAHQLDRGGGMWCNERTANNYKNGGFMRIKNFCLLGALVFLALVFNPVQAHASIWEFLFPFLKSPNAPSETMKAPFANEDAVYEGLDASGNRENASPLHLKHRTNTKMTEWLLLTIPDLLSYQADNYEDLYRERSRLFNEIGEKEYATFLHNANIIKTLQSGAYDVSGFIKEYPVVVNEGPADNRYRWVYKMTAMITYIKGGTTNYEAINDSDAISQEWEIVFQVGRSREAANDAGVFIETWSAEKK